MDCAGSVDPCGTGDTEPVEFCYDDRRATCGCWRRVRSWRPGALTLAW